MAVAAMESCKPAGGRTRQQIVPFSLPLVSLDTIITGVCGQGIFENNASLFENGWFFSNLYLFDHFFRDNAIEQHWLTSVSLDTLVKKHPEHAQGNPGTSDRRVVLDMDFGNDCRCHIKYTY